MTTHHTVKKSTYVDSVSLMAISTKANQIEGVTQAFVAMGTPMNKEVLANLNLLTAELDAATGGDLMVVLETESPDQLEGALQALDDLLARKNSDTGASQTRYRTLDAALASAPESNLVMISVNGSFAAREAQKALTSGKNVLMFSDNVSVADELALKQLAHDKGLLMMGPDCGTAIFGGVALAFGNAVRRGSIGSIGASGTGSQEISVRVHDFGGGISQLIGTGGRDLSADIGGITMIDAIHALDADPETEVIVLVSKPPAPSVEDKVLAVAGQISKPVIVCFLGSERSDSPYENVTFVAGTKPAALAAVLATGVDESTLDLHSLNWPLIEEVRAKLTPEQKYIRGLFCGGTLCDEALYAALATYPDVYSNIQKDPAYQLTARSASKAHTFLDLGDDEFTDGKPHPMIDPSNRLARIVAEAADPEVGVLVMDFIVGFGSHEDPVGVTIPAIVEAQRIARDDGRHLEILGYVLGTDLDTPSVAAQIAQLEAVGVTIASSSTNTGLLAREFVAKENN